MTKKQYRMPVRYGSLSMEYRYLGCLPVARTVGQANVITHAQPEKKPVR
ncbi:hypothetical protein LH435_01725 [Laribacter hongkongensis]|nr:hypothetical protein [Laribacter hongkongensis]MCG8994750.1 hypothetical protein [Laribacter hongkongensis]MCG9009533.1 hypothetical protein [Laribacter hongkongensis]MCG9021566.1 hypothetical protein [Laribacter hongkongensis]MCG9045819.1 hypothetical protein [Laribacter hongkongensis]MCG9072748.1 hypothetical protein [Laribacter hongkongensis]